MQSEVKKAAAFILALFSAALILVQPQHESSAMSAKTKVPEIAQKMDKSGQQEVQLKEVTFFISGMV